jgi:Tol biopolymer transport system component
MLKRKREEQKRQTYWMLAVLLLLLPLLLMVAGVAKHFVPGFPGARDLRLMYNSDGFQHTLNVMTGEDSITGVADYYSHLNAISPDGRWLAEWSMMQGAANWRLTLVDLYGGEDRTFGPYEVGYPTLSWSPDSAWLAFGAGNEKIGLMEGSELFLLNPKNGALKRLTDNGYRDDAPAFSPDGTRLVFVSSQDGYNRLYIMDLETRARTLVSPYTFGYMPAWSPDGSLIAFMSNQQDAHGDIYLIAADGSGLTRLTITQATDDSPAWAR